jgi:hypothetical protein
MYHIHKMHNITYVKHSTWFLILVFINNMCEYFRLYRHQWLDPHEVFNNCHIFCCNMFVFACPIIAKCQCWLFALSGQISVFALFALKYPYLPSYIRICPRIQLPVSAQWSQRLYVNVQGKMMHKDMHKIVFQSN